ncbi:MAG: acyltransferase [Bacteroidetes bacterium]|nr:acyltransferase [Bacteroidota bacterium]
MKPTRATVALIQMSCTENPKENIEKVCALIREAAQKGGQIIVLQELYQSLYFCDVEDYKRFSLAEPIPGPSTEYLSELAAELEIVIVASLFEKRAEGLYHNTAVVLDADGKLAGKYRKMHIPDDPGYFEKFYFTPGDLGYQAISTRYGKIGVLVCWDQWYPEAARLTALKGVDMLVYPTAIGWHNSQSEEVNDEQYQAWYTIQRSHAVANGVPVISVNRIGEEGEMKFWGQSFVTNAFGKTLNKASVDQQEILLQELDYSESDSFRTHWPFLRDRRIDSYAPLTKRFIDDDTQT